MRAITTLSHQEAMTIIEAVRAYLEGSRSKRRCLSARKMILRFSW